MEPCNDDLHLPTAKNDLKVASIKVMATFDAESENSVDMQKSGWQAILDNFKMYTESQ